MPDQEKMACTDRRRCTGLLDLPENLITSILQRLPAKSKCQAEVVCKSLREVLGNPAPGTFVRGCLDLEDPFFERAPLQELNRWLLRRTQGVLRLHHCGKPDEGGQAYMEVPVEARRDQQIVLFTLPLVSGLLSPEASVHLDLRWVKWEGLFPPEEPKFVDWYWSSMAAVLTSLELSIDVDEVHKGISATLCQLTRLERLGLADAPGNIAQTGLEPMATLSLDLPLLEWLEITEVDLGLIELSCPKLVELVLENVLLMGFRGMPDSIQKVSLTLSDGSVPLQEIIPAHSAKSLEELLVLTNATHCEGEIGQGFTDPEVVKEVCLNGKLRRLVMEDVSFHAGAFSVAALWQAIPHTLEDVSLELALDEGIPRILEELINLTALCPEHAGGSCMHLDRPLDPFLDMLRLESLQLLSCWNRGLLDGTGMRMWSPPALRFLGLAEKRIRQMQLTPPGRSISLTY